MGASEIDWLVAEASSTSVTTARLRELAGHDAVEVREAVAKRDDLPDDVIAHLAGDAYDMIRRHVAERAEWPARSLLWGGGYPPPVAMRIDIAHRRALPLDAWELLAEDPYPEVREALARNPELTVWAARRLAEDPDTGVRQTVARREILPDEVVERLARDDEASVRVTVARRRSLSALVVCQLWHDSDPEVRARLWSSWGGA